MRSRFALLALAGALFSSTPVLADDHGQDEHGHVEALEHAEAAGEEAAAPDAHGGGHAPTFDDVNWFYGILGERDGVEPNIIYRPTGMPVPLTALLFNSAILFYLLYRMLGQSVSDGLKNRKQTLLRGMEEAAKMRREAEEQLLGYEQKLERIEDEIERVKNEMVQTGEAERKRVLSEARERRTRMERDAHQLVAQELKAVRERLLRETVASAVRSATETLQNKLTADDQQRLAEEYVSGLARAAGTLRGRV